MTNYVIFYELAAEGRSTVPPAFPAHMARLREFRHRGSLLMAGTFADPQQAESMLIFRDRHAAEEFVEGDPFVLTGVVRTWIIREWHDVWAEL